LRTLPFELSEEQRLIRQSVHQFAKKELAPKAPYWDATEEFPWESVKKMAELGLTGLRLPKVHGGSDLDLISTGIALEEVARFDHSCAIILCASNITARLLLNASEHVRVPYLSEVAKGKSVPAFAAMESEAGSDIRAISTYATRQHDSYIVNGEKSMITFAGVADAFIVLAKTSKGREDISCLFIESSRPGIDIQPLRGFGWRATRWGNIALDDVAVPTGNLVGIENRALAMLKSTVQEQRALTGLIALGTAKEAIEEAIEYAKNRKVFGQPLGKFEGIQFRLAEDFTSLEAARLVCYRALSLIDKQADEAALWSAMANLIGGETAYRVVDNAMDVYGGVGYTRDLPIERYLRDVKATQIANATLKMEIGRGLLGKEFIPYA